MSHTPSPQQQAVIDWALEEKGHLNLIARAGCGKTSTLMMLVDQLPEEDSIFVGAFNRSIAAELEARLKTAGHDWKHARASTMHSAGLGAWRKQAPDVKVDKDKMKHILAGFAEDDESDAEVVKAVGGLIIKLAGFAKQGAFGVGGQPEIDDYSAYYQIIDHFGLDMELPEGIDVCKLVDFTVDAIYASAKQDHEVVDFNDMLWVPLRRNARFWPYDWVLIDEAQDTNEARRLIAYRMLKPKYGRLVAVGDPKQALYSFTGADSRAMDMIKQGLDSEELNLTVTYRCPKKVVAHVNGLCPDLVAHEDNPDGVVRKLPYSSFDPEKVPDFWQEASGLTPDDVILCRKNAPLISLAFAMIRKGIGCQIEGRDIAEGLVALANRWKRAKTLDKLLEKLDEYRNREVAKAMEADNEAKAERITDQCEALKVMAESLLEQGRTDRGDLIRSIRSMFGDTEPGQKPAVVTLSTVHKAKGREWKRVYILGRNAYMPLPFAKLPWEMEAENNIIYVAITRAMEELVEISV